MIWIISGPSSAGKSTFVKNPSCHEITGLAASAPMITPARQSGFAAQDLGDCFFHYNICRPAWAALRDKRSDVRDLSDEKKAVACQFGSDAKWVDLLQNKAEKKAVVLVADKATILDRVNRRRFVEPHVSTGKDKRYNAEFWQKLYERTDLTGVYKAWCAELERCKIPYVLINANDSRYSVLPPDFTFDAAAKNSMSPASLSKEEIEKILREEKFAYHRVNLPYGLHTDGQDRSATRDLIFPESMVGESILDVGCALGYFCFEAEIRGATRILGVELKDSRFRQALILKSILGSNVEFLQRDVVENPISEQFDHILLLNILHHLPDPTRMIRQLALQTRKRLVIEFPTFADDKFRKSVGIRFPKLYNRLPLIGVSSMAPGTDQTFVFTPAAIQRIVQDHQRLFQKVTFIESPMPGRKIAICEK